MKKRNILNTVNKLNSLPLPEKEKILAACDAVVPEAVSVEGRARPKLQRFTPRKAVVLAMAAMLMVGGSLTVAAAEAKAYNEAIDFFEQYNMSAEGFTRSEVKKIYKDIVSESFTYEKTEEALASGLNGYEIQAQPLDSEGLKRVWMLGYVWELEEQQQTVEEGVLYLTGHTSVPYIGMCSSLSKCKEGERLKLLWEIYFTEMSIHLTEPVSNGVVVAGRPITEGSTNKSGMVRVKLINADSTEVWQKDFDCGMIQPEIDYILYRDNTITLFVISYKYNYMWIATIDMDGNLLGYEYVEYDPIGDDIEKAVPVGDGYLMLKGDRLIQEKDGKVQSTVTFGTETEQYQIDDMIEFNGLVYLSGKIAPMDNGVDQLGLFDKYVEQFGETLCSDEELAQLFKDNHSAVLLICDPDTGEPRKFYTVPGASGGSLSVQGNKLTWNVNRYTGAEHLDDDFHGVSLIYQAGGGFGLIKADIWRYVFNPYGQVVGETDTGKSAEFEEFPY